MKTFVLIDFILFVFFPSAEQSLRSERLDGLVGHVVQRQSATVHRLLPLRLHASRIRVSVTPFFRRQTWHLHIKRDALHGFVYRPKQRLEKTPSQPLTILRLNPLIP